MNPVGGPPKSAEVNFASTDVIKKDQHLIITANTGAFSACVLFIHSWRPFMNVIQQEPEKLFGKR